MEINIVVDYPNAGNKYKYWASEEDRIDFFSEKEKATRCTLSFAACELEKYLSLVINDIHVSVGNSLSKDAFNIILNAGNGLKDSFNLKPINNGLEINGDNRVGVLYGAYELIKKQGVNWIEPGVIGEVIPAKINTIVLPTELEEYDTTGEEARGFALDGELNESPELVLWMARNKLNSYFIRPHTNGLMHKLGFKLCAGGHIFEKFLNPDLVLDDGRTLFDAKKEWYGKPLDKELTKENAMSTQFCVSNHELLTYLAEKLIDCINHEWKEADEINVWGFDTWGGVCSCPNCTKLGNGTDQNIHMLSFFRDYLNKAFEDKRISHNVKLILCLYEGTVTLEAPLNPIPKNLIEAGDHCLYAPIVRCYDHYFDDKDCSYNSHYFKHLSNWSSIKDRMPISILEYYNVTKFEDLPLIFSMTMEHDFHAYYKLGVRGYNYMHIPMVNWGVRALTQNVYAALAWNINSDVNSLTEKYFIDRYAMYSSSMKEVYELLNDATRTITSWRSWKLTPILLKLQWWDGAIPSEPLEIDDHLLTMDNAIEDGKRIAIDLSKAYELVNSCIKDAKSKQDLTNRKLIASNPVELLKAQNQDKVLKFLLDDKRGIKYGKDVQLLELLLLQYYDALFTKQFSKADDLWNEIESLEEEMESYYMPIKYSNSTISIISQDALTRSQLTEVVARCRKQRKSLK